MKHRFLIPLHLIFIIINGYAQQPPADIVNGLNSIFQGHVNQTIGMVPGHVIRIEKPGSWVYENAAGLAVVNSNVTTQSDMKFKVASITKMFTTVAIFKLIQSGQLAFNGTIDQYLPVLKIQHFTNYQNIKIKNLLSHTSGIAEPQAEYQGRLNYWIYKKPFNDIPIDSLLYWSSANPGVIGTYQYSNANFYLLAEIIQSVTGNSHKKFITDSIITPLGLTNTDFNTIPTGSFMRGYLKGSFYPNGGVADGLVPDSIYDFTQASNSWGYGAADIWSNTIDLIKFHKALFGGQLIKTNWLDTMKQVLTITGDMGSYGYGMIQFNSYNNGPIYGLGHTGSAFGYGSMLCYIPALNIYMASAGNYMKIGQEFLQRDIYNFLNGNVKNAIEAPATDHSIMIYPNPTNDRLLINSQHATYLVSLSDITGNVLFTLHDARTLDMTSYARGIYILKISDENENILCARKVIKN